MKQVDIAAWIDEEPEAARRLFRQAVHIVLMAVSQQPEMRASMVMKGGILLALRYGSSRYTRDVDFSTTMRYQQFDLEKFLGEFRQGLATAIARTDYGLDCRLQSYELMPSNRPEASFPTLRLKIAYAETSNARSIEKVRAGTGSDIVQLDYSFNEVMQQAEILKLGDGAEIEAYSLSDLIAEKLRAILQQEVRNRIRRQDAYDIYRLLQTVQVSREEQAAILTALERSAASRDMAVNRLSLRNEAIRVRSAAEYNQLQAEITEHLPPFEETWAAVLRFYEGLPWNSVVPRG